MEAVRALPKRWSRARRGQPVNTLLVPPHCFLIFHHATGRAGAELWVVVKRNDQELRIPAV